MYNLHKVLTDNTLNHTSNFIASDIDVAESTVGYCPFDWFFYNNQI